MKITIKPMIWPEVSPVSSWLSGAEGVVETSSWGLPIYSCWEVVCGVSSVIFLGFLEPCTSSLL